MLKSKHDFCLGLPLRMALFAAGLCAAVGCRSPVVSRPLPSAVEEHRHETLDPKLVAGLTGETSDPQSPANEERDGGAYRVGPGDTVLVAVYGHPELSIATYAGTALVVQGNRTGGLVVDNDGTIQFPLIGTVQVAGKTSAELRVYLEHELGRYLKDPKITVQPLFNGSIRYYLLGQFSEPGLKFSDRPLRLLEALSLGGSIVLEHASLRSAYVARGQKRLPINFRRLVREGDLKQNIKLRTGDVVVVPDNTSEQAFVFGAIAGNVKGGAVPFVNGYLDIAQALAQAGFGFRERFQARFAKTRVIRSEGDRGEVFTVNVAKILRGSAAPFPLVPGDVIYVPARGYTNWNLALEQLLPSLQTVSGLLTPFVQLKYLTNN